MNDERVTALEQNVAGLAAVVEQIGALAGMALALLHELGALDEADWRDAERELHKAVEKAARLRRTLPPPGVSNG